MGASLAFIHLTEAPRNVPLAGRTELRRRRQSTSGFGIRGGGHSYYSSIPDLAYGPVRSSKNFEHDELTNDSAVAASKFQWKYAGQNGSNAHYVVSVDKLLHSLGLRLTEQAFRASLSQRFLK